MIKSERTAHRLSLSVILLLSTAPVVRSMQAGPTPADTLTLEKAVVTTSRAVTVAASAVDAEQGSSLSVADVLDGKAGLSKGGDGIWATNVSFRGFGENRLVTLIDNNRVETATDLTVSLSMIDVNDVDRIEVIAGARSSIYGSGAIGGIINVVTKDGHFSPQAYFNGRASADYSSVNKGYRTYLSLQGGGKRWYVKANGAFSGASDAATPLGHLNNSGYHSSNAGLTAAFKPVPNHTVKAQFQFNHSWNVGIPGGSSFSPQAAASYKNIDRTMASIGYEIAEPAPCLNLLQFKIWYQGILRDVEVFPGAAQPQSGAQPTKLTPYATHRTFGAKAGSKWTFSGWNKLSAGAELWRRQISGTRNKYINQYALGALTARMIRNEKTLPEASHTSAGIFLLDEMLFFHDRLIISVGARADINAVQNSECHNVEFVKNETTGAVNFEPQGKYVTFQAGKRVDPSWSANAGIIFKAGAKCELTADISRTYRSPALEELFKFIDLTGNKIHFGNPELKPEKGLGGDIGIRFHGNRLNFRASAYINSVRDMIVEKKTNVNSLSVNDTLVLGNTGKALLYGFDAEASFEIFKGLGIHASGSWTTGREIAPEESRLPMIPPINGRLGICYENPRILGADLSLTAAGEKKDWQTAQGEKPVAAWCRLDFSIHSKEFSFRWCKLQISGGIDNITNAAYINFLSTYRGSIICEPGRNFYLRASLTF